jgi:uncharacterized Zn finger protein (UPF0148 family)
MITHSYYIKIYVLKRQIGEILRFSELPQIAKVISNIGVAEFLGDVGKLRKLVHRMALPFGNFIYLGEIIKYIEKCAVAIRRSVRQRKIPTRCEELKNLHALLNEQVVFQVDGRGDTCPECDNHLVRHVNNMYCPKCDTIQGNVLLFKDEELDEDTKSGKMNISKHYDTNINKLYGIVDPKHVLDDKIITNLRKELDAQKFNIYGQVHYTYELLQKLKKIKYVECDGVRHHINTQKGSVNYLLLKMYPDLEIPKLNTYELGILRNTFLSITSESCQLYPDSYNNYYLYTIHRILYMLFYNQHHIRQLLRFIYIQEPTSFMSKDVRLKSINDKINCFKIFAYVPTDIYTNINYYKIE